jgi:hypothetical protein
MDSNRTLVEANYGFDKPALIEPEEDLEALPEYSRPTRLHQGMFLFHHGVEYATIPMPRFKLEIMAHYFSFVLCMGCLNREIRPLLFPADRAPLGLLAHVMARKKRHNDEIFCILIERPDIVGIIHNAAGEK